MTRSNNQFKGSEVEEAFILMDIIMSLSDKQLMRGRTEYLDPVEFDPELLPIIERLNGLYSIWQRRGQAIRDWEF